MKKLAIFVFMAVIAHSSFAQDQYIFPYGGGQNKYFINEIIKLTGKERPRICYLPTASGDNEAGIIRFYDLVSDLSVEPHHQKVWISSYNQKQSFEEVLLSMDAIYVGEATPST